MIININRAWRTLIRMLIASLRAWGCAITSLRLGTSHFSATLAARAQEMTESDLSRKTLREDVEALRDLYSHIQNLNRICRSHEEILLQKMVQGADLKRLSQIIQLYRSTCSSCEPPWENLHEIRDRALFWFHVWRLRLACELWRLWHTPRLCCSMALHSLQALEVLTPGVLDAL